MRIDCKIKSLRIKAPAKLNLFLKVTGRRTDGYHELISIMVPVSLFDVIDINVKESDGIHLTCEGFPAPIDESNLVCRAVRSFLSFTGIHAGFSIVLQKTVPMAAGLGGGSSDAAATLIGMNEMWGRHLNQPVMKELAVELGADVPFFLDCRPALARGIGDILEPLGNWPDLWYVMVNPRIQISTAWVYSNLKLELTRGDYHYIFDLLNQDPIDVPRILENDLETVSCAHFPVIKEIKKDLIEAGAEGALMSGSGPTVFGVFGTREKAVAAKASLLARDLGDVFMVTKWERPPDHSSSSS